MVRSFVFLSCRLEFDPPQTSFAIASMQKQLDEKIWRIRVLADRLHSPTDEDLLVGALKGGIMEDTRTTWRTTKNYMAHYGVKGMRWGVRKKRAPSAPVSQDPVDVTIKSHRAGRSDLRR